MLIKCDITIHLGRVSYSYDRVHASHYMDNHSSSSYCSKYLTIFASSLQMIMIHRISSRECRVKVAEVQS